MRIIAVGDIMPGGVLNGTDRPFLAPDVKNLLASGDIRVGTLETAIGNAPTFYEEKMKRKADVIYAEDDDMKRLVEMNINIVSLANNHFFDLGPEGATHTIELLDRMGIKHCGAGRILEEASKPAVVVLEGKSYAFLAFCDWRDETTGWCPFATANEPGVNPLYDEHVIREIKRNKEKYDYVIVIPHWGVEYNYRPTANVYKLANKMIKAGADLILGGHTHCVQPVIKTRGSVVVFSMGNFLFPDRLICPPRSTYYTHQPVDLTSIPSTDGYPYVDQVTYKKWKNIARHGMIVSVHVHAGMIESKTYFTFMDNDNFLSLSNLERDTTKRIKIIGFIIKSGFYILFCCMWNLRCSVIARLNN